MHRYQSCGGVTAASSFYHLAHGQQGCCSTRRLTYKRPLPRNLPTDQLFGCLRHKGCQHKRQRYDFGPSHSVRCNSTSLIHSAVLVPVFPRLHRLESCQHRLLWAAEHRWSAHSPELFQPTCGDGAVRHVDPHGRFVTPACTFIPMTFGISMVSEAQPSSDGVFRPVLLIATERRPGFCPSSNANWNAYYQQIHKYSK